VKYSDQIAEWLKDLGYDTFYFVGGGNIMHLTESLDRHLNASPVIHEVAAVIAAEYHNHLAGSEKALALVTAGPGITNTITGLAGAYLESRYVLVIGGQVKTDDLSRGDTRQNGIQEIDGVTICEPLTNYSVRLDKPIGKTEFHKYAVPNKNIRKAPVFLEIPLDVQAVQYISSIGEIVEEYEVETMPFNEKKLAEMADMLRSSQRPVFLLGGGVDIESAQCVERYAVKNSIPVATTWNGADLISSDLPVYIGRPNTWGQRSSNILIQQADLVICLGTRLGLQQTGFNWQAFVPVGKVICIELDSSELMKGHPNIDLPILGDCNAYIRRLTEMASDKVWETWLNFCVQTRAAIPLVEEDINEEFAGFIAPQGFVTSLSALMRANDVLIPCSSGSAFTTAMQCFQQKKGQRIITNKALASMGYGLSGAIGAAISSGLRTVLLEGDGGFSQNMQELGTVAAQNLNIKIFIFDDAGHASIRMTQRNYFSGKYIGCDRATNLGLPNWDKVGDVWGIETMRLSNLKDLSQKVFQVLFNKTGPAIFILSICPDQTYFPKIASRMLPTGSMESNPLHAMSPPLSDSISGKVFRYINPPEY
jgi:acetolactate synthase-1/2/3 large subunit